MITNIAPIITRRRDSNAMCVIQFYNAQYYHIIFETRLADNNSTSECLIVQIHLTRARQRQWMVADVSCQSLGGPLQ